jgi:hypothetical protein
VHAQRYVFNFSLETPFHSVMWNAAFSHEILLDCTVITLHVRGGNTMPQNCLIVGHFMCRNLLSCSDSWFRRASTFYQQIAVEICDKVHMFPNAIVAIFS